MSRSVINRSVANKGMSSLEEKQFGFNIRVDNPRNPPLLTKPRNPPLVFGRILKTHKDLARILKIFRPPSAARKICDFEGFYRGN